MSRIARILRPGRKRLALLMVIALVAPLFLFISAGISEHVAALLEIAGILLALVALFLFTSVSGQQQTEATLPSTTKPVESKAPSSTKPEVPSEATPSIATPAATQQAARIASNES